MPDVLWPLFQQNRHLLHALPVLIMVIFYTFGRHLNFNCHLVRSKYSCGFPMVET